MEARVLRASSELLGEVEFEKKCQCFSQKSLETGIWGLVESGNPNLKKSPYCFRNNSLNDFFVENVEFV